MHPTRVSANRPRSLERPPWTFFKHFSRRWWARKNPLAYSESGSVFLSSLPSLSNSSVYVISSSMHASHSSAPSSALDPATAAVTAALSRPRVALTQLSRPLLQSLYPRATFLRGDTRVFIDFPCPACGIRPLTLPRRTEPTADQPQRPRKYWQQVRRSLLPLALQET